MLPVSGHGDLPVGPLTGQVYADAGDDCGAVQEAEGGQVEAVGRLEGVWTVSEGQIGKRDADVERRDGGRLD